MLSDIPFRHLLGSLGGLSVLLLATAGGCSNSDQDTARTDPHDSRIALGAAPSTQDDDADDDDDDDDVDVALADVPDLVKKAATNAVPGFVLKEAEREGEGADAVYDLEGTANGTWYEIEVTAAGVVKEIEIGSDEDDDDDDDDDDGHS
jgi:hypothetical protein